MLRFSCLQCFSGGVKVSLCGLVQYIGIFGIAIGYTIASSISMMWVGLLTETPLTSLFFLVFFEAWLISLVHGYWQGNQKVKLFPSKWWTEPMSRFEQPVHDHFWHHRNSTFSDSRLRSAVVALYRCRGHVVYLLYHWSWPWHWQSCRSIFALTICISVRQRVYLFPYASLTLAANETFIFYFLWDCS